MIRCNLPNHGNRPLTRGGGPFNRFRRLTMFDFLKKFLKTSNDAEIKKLRKIVD